MLTLTTRYQLHQLQRLAIVLGTSYTGSKPVIAQRVYNALLKSRFSWAVEERLRGMRRRSGHGTARILCVKMRREGGEEKKGVGMEAAVCVLEVPMDGEVGREGKGAGWENGRKKERKGGNLLPNVLVWERISVGGGREEGGKRKIEKEQEDGEEENVDRWRTIQDSTLYSYEFASKLLHLGDDISGDIVVSDGDIHHTSNYDYDHNHTIKHSRSQQKYLSEQQECGGHNQHKQPTKPTYPPHQILFSFQHYRLNSRCAVMIGAVAGRLRAFADEGCWGGANKRGDGGGKDEDEDQDGSEAGDEAEDSGDEEAQLFCAQNFHVHRSKHYDRHMDVDVNGNRRFPGTGATAISRWKRYTNEVWDNMNTNTGMEELICGVDPIRVIAYWREWVAVKLRLQLAELGRRNGAGWMGKPKVDMGLGSLNSRAGDSYERQYQHNDDGNYDLAIIKVKETKEFMCLLGKRLLRDAIDAQSDFTSVKVEAQFTLSKQNPRSSSHGHVEGGFHHGRLDETIRLVLGYTSPKLQTSGPEPPASSPFPLHQTEKDSEPIESRSIEDLAECLLQGLAWIQWENKRREILARESESGELWKRDIV